MASFTATVRSNTRVARFRSTRLVSTFACGGQRAWSSGNFTRCCFFFFSFFFGVQCAQRHLCVDDDENVWSNRSRKMFRERVVRERHRSERSTLILTRISLLRPPNSRSSRLSPANSRTAPSLRYAFSLWFFIIVLCAFYAKLEKAKVTRDRE